MRYCVHDGPGIRSTVFFKGCQLSCKWCHNPESQDINPEQVFYPEKCIKCGHCARQGGDQNCPTGAKETIGYEITIPYLMNEISKDLPFYEESGGGVTFSGGEPLYQAEFLLEVLAECKKECINTAIDTSGYCDTEPLLKAAQLADYILYDIKSIDSGKHVEYCGVPNDLILENLKQLSNSKAKLLIRIPVIPAINDGIGEMKEIFDFIKNFDNIDAVHLLPYHNIHSDKYRRIGKLYELPQVNGDESPNMNEIQKLFETRFRTKVGG
jgi:pyruvate formate lyase activating enzyme